MEFPNLGLHCCEKSCNRLDFLPVKCDSCNQVFCSNHFNYERHNCPHAHRKDIQVPVCPLCGEPVPTAPDVSPDLTVGNHIDQQCKSDTKKIFTNRCSYKNCKRKELIPVTCSECKRNFCLRHRHTADHECKTSRNGNSTGPGTSSSSKSESIFRNGKIDERTMAAKAAEYRRSHKPNTLFDAAPKPSVTIAAQRANPSQTNVQNIQGNMSEDEALARALALSIMELDETADRNRRNAAAEAAAASAQRNNTVRVGGRDNQQGNSKDKCLLS